ncbi:cupin [Thioalkalivibrio paradoxus ARh 1]|uniref:Cupin n=2 Tax=Thioalkalivibrio paradoxus TaxID=108010 RepID=W0DIG4_9GAMM|nr:cupin domain-containing protein [Thioalkalivibrio paradoxus]AHE98181.1 cupin [Thioalkalivibrio paradoxus ARh 1]
MKNHNSRSLAIGAMSVAGSMMLLLAVATTAHAGPDPITAEPLTQRHTFSGNVSMQITQELDGLPKHVVNLDDASNVVVVEFTIQPGAVFPWHTHPGTVLINITEGDFVFMFAEDCVGREYGPGMALVDPGHSVHTAYNPSRDEPTVVIATLLGAPDEGPLTIPVDADEGAALDEKCGISTGTHAH